MDFYSLAVLILELILLSPYTNWFIKLIIHCMIIAISRINITFYSFIVFTYLIVLFFLFNYYCWILFTVIICFYYLFIFYLLIFLLLFDYSPLSLFFYAFNCFTINYFSFYLLIICFYSFSFHYSLNNIGIYLFYIIRWINNRFSAKKNWTF